MWSWLNSCITKNRGVEWGWKLGQPKGQKYTQYYRLRITAWGGVEESRIWAWLGGLDTLHFIITCTSLYFLLLRTRAYHNNSTTVLFHRVFALGAYITLHYYITSPLSFTSFTWHSNHNYRLSPLFKLCLQYFRKLEKWCIIVFIQAISYHNQSIFLKY